LLEGPLDEPHKEKLFPKGILPAMTTLI
jgi:hypothetical protein